MLSQARVRPMNAEQIILKYWNSWQEPADFDEMQSCLADDIELNFAGQEVKGAAAFRAMVEASADPWRDVKLIDSHFGDDGGSIIYEGTSSKQGARIRVAEIVHVRDGRIVGATAVFAPAPASS